MTQILYVFRGSGRFRPKNDLKGIFEKLLN
jgi:hypothetical protein